MIKREDFYNELMLREYIRKAIKKIKGQKVVKSIVNEEQRLRKFVQRLIEASSVDDEVPHQSTGINVLEELLKRIIPTLEDGYKSLTTNKEQRTSFRAHIIHAIQNSLAPQQAEDGVDGEENDKFINIDENIAENQSISNVEDDEVISEEENVTISVSADDDEKTTETDNFIDIENDTAISKKEKEKEERLKSFTIEGHDETGRNMALETFDSIESNIIDYYATLENEEDKEDFFDYLIVNVKLYMDRWEMELQKVLMEPTNPEYEAAKDEIEAEQN
jgi:hypothetical protein